MSSTNKFFIKKSINPKEGNISGITAVNICDRHLITGDEKGNVVTYEFGQNDILNKIKETNLKSRIEKILVYPNRKLAFILVGGEVYCVKIPLMQNVQSILKTKDTVNIFFFISPK